MNEKILSILEKLKAEAEYYKQFKNDNRAGSEYLTGKGAGIEQAIKEVEETLNVNREDGVA